jgi:hypothetical protein
LAGERWQHNLKLMAYCGKFSPRFRIVFQLREEKVNSLRERHGLASERCPQAGFAAIKVEGLRKWRLKKVANGK